MLPRETLQAVVDRFPGRLETVSGTLRTGAGRDARIAWQAFAEAAAIPIDATYEVEGFRFTCEPDRGTDRLEFGVYRRDDAWGLEIAREVGLYDEHTDYLGTVICWLSVQTEAPLPDQHEPDSVVGHGGLDDRSYGPGDPSPLNAPAWRRAVERSKFFGVAMARPASIKLGLYDR